LQGLTLHLVPQPVQLVERRAANLDAALLGEQLHRLEPPRELVIRPLECGARVDGELAREIHHCEQQIADLIFYPLPFPLSRFPLNLPRPPFPFSNRPFRSGPSDPTPPAPFLRP